MAAATALAVLQQQPLDRNQEGVAALAAWLQRQPLFAGGLALAQLQQLCAAAGHAAVEEGGCVFRQGVPGDCMYVVLKGYVALTRRPPPLTSSTLQPQLPAGPGSRRGSTGGGGGGSVPQSRRATAEQQVLRFAQATGTITPGSSRRGTLEEAPAAAGLGSAQPLLLQSPRLAAALQSPRLPAAGLAGSRRSTMEAVGQPAEPEVHAGWVSEGEAFGQAALLSPSKARAVSAMAGDGGVVLLVLDRASYGRLPASAAQALRVACTRQLLAVPPGKRTAEQVDALEELLGGFDSLQRLPLPVRTRLAKSCQAQLLPAGSVVCEEDQKGDAMFVVLTGCCQVRSRPLKTTPADTAAAPPWQLSGPDSRIAEAADGSAGSSGGGASAGKLAAGLLDEPDDQVTSSSSSAGGDAADGKPDGAYWTQQFMASAVASASAADTHWGLQGGMTPLAAVFAAKWRQQMRQQQQAKNAAQQTGDGMAAADKAYAAMEELLGKAGAKAWKAARDGAAAAAAHQSVGAAKTVATGAPPAGAASSSCSIGGDSVAAGLAQCSSSQCSSTAAAAALCATASSSSVEGSGCFATAPAASAAGIASAEELLSAAACAPDPAESLKLQLAAVGVRDPAEVGRRLMEEVVARTDLQGLLASVAQVLHAAGRLPQRLNKRGSLKITKAVNRCMLGGAAWKGCGISSSTNLQQDDSTSPSKTQRGGDGEPGSGLAAEATATSTSCDWRSSIDGSEAASLYQSMEADDTGCSGSFARSSLAPLLMSAAAAAPAGAAAALSSEGAQAARQLSAEQMEGAFGPVVRLLGPGDSFGELALLQRSATRTATVVVAPAAADSADTSAELIVISKSCYDATVCSIHVSALEELLGFLAGVSAFKGLSRDVLTSLAVFARPLQAAPGQLLVLAGQPAEALIIIQEGEVKLVDAPAGAGALTPAAAPSVLPGARRATADEVLLRQRMPLASTSRLLDKQLSQPAMLQQRLGGGHGLLTVPSSSPRGGHSSVACGTASAPLMSAVAVERIAASAVPLAVLGPGSLLGENVLGYSSSNSTQQVADTPVHTATALALRPCRLLLLAAADLRRFGRRLRAPLVQLADDRRDFLQLRRASLQGYATKASLSQMVADMRQQLAAADSAAPATAAATPLALQQPPGRLGGFSVSSSTGAAPHSKTALASSTAAAISAATQGVLLPRSSSGRAVAGSQWHQQAWRQAAFGQLLQQPAEQQLPSVAASDVARLKQLVPGMMPAPCVSELAAAARPLPAGMLCATSAAQLADDMLLPGASAGCLPACGSSSTCTPR